MVFVFLCLSIPVVTQNDFHPKEGEEPNEGGEVDEWYHKEGSLAVPNANEDSRRIAKMILANLDAIDSIVVTLDSHHVSAS